MIRLIIVLVFIIPFSINGQEGKNLKELSSNEFAAFPRDFEITQMVFKHYYNLGVIKNQFDSLNDVQKTLCTHFICTGLIDNSGFYSILLETRGKYNVEYSKSLNRMADRKSLKLFEKIVSIYNQFESWFFKNELPPNLDKNSIDYDKKLVKRIEKLERKWYANNKSREKLFELYISEHKLELVSNK